LYGPVGEDLPFHLGDIGCPVTGGRSAPAGVLRRSQLIAGIELGEGLDQLLRIVGEILEDVQVLAQRVERNSVLIAARLQEFDNTQALVAFQVEGRVELIEQHDRGTGQRLAAGIVAVGNDAIGDGSGRERDRRGWGRRGQSVDFAEDVQRLAFALAGIERARHGTFQGFAIVEGEIVLGKSAHGTVFVADDDVHLDETGARAEDGLLLCCCGACEQEEDRPRFFSRGDVVILHGGKAGLRQSMTCRLQL
jgi:hypothetical protein